MYQLAMDIKLSDQRNPTKWKFSVDHIFVSLSATLQQINSVVQSVCWKKTLKLCAGNNTHYIHALGDFV